MDENCPPKGLREASAIRIRMLNNIADSKVVRKALNFGNNDNNVKQINPEDII